MLKMEKFRLACCRSGTVPGGLILPAALCGARTQMVPVSCLSYVQAIPCKLLSHGLTEPASLLRLALTRGNIRVGVEFICFCK